MSVKISAFVEFSRFDEVKSLTNFSIAVFIFCLKVLGLPPFCKYPPPWTFLKPHPYCNLLILTILLIAAVLTGPLNHHYYF